MGEKIPYKARKPGGGRKKRKPEYDAGKKRKSATAQLDFTSLIAEKAAAKDALVSDIAALEENVNNLKTELKEKKAELKKLDTELSKLEAQKAEADAKAAAEAQKAELEETIQKLMADGVSAAEILEKLK